MGSKECAIGVDLGGTKLEVALVNSSGKIEHKKRVKTRVSEGKEAVISDIIQLADDLKNVSPVLPMGLGLGTAGQVDPISGTVHFSPNLNWHHVPLQADLAKALQLPVIVLNDVRAATWGEWLHGAGEGEKDLVCLFVGTGIGAGIVSGGHMLQGTTNTAGEVGHMTLDLNGPPCTCGNWGCFESLVSGWAIKKRAIKAVTENSAKGKKILESSDGSVENISAKAVFSAAREGDSLAQELVNQAGSALIAGVASLINAFNPKTIILGGGVIQGWPEFVPLVQEGIKKRALAVAQAKVQIVESKLLGDAGVIGAASLVMRSGFQDGGK